VQVLGYISREYKCLLMCIMHTAILYIFTYFYLIYVCITTTNTLPTTYIITDNGTIEKHKNVRQVTLNSA
jgi:hypothetical protein